MGEIASESPFPFTHQALRESQPMRQFSLDTQLRRKMTGRGQRGCWAGHIQGLHLRIISPLLRAPALDNAAAAVGEVAVAVAARGADALVHAALRRSNRAPN